MALPKVSSYGRYENKNYGVNTLQVTIDDIDLYFSYKTCIAYRVGGGELVIRENDWGPTTGKHMRWIMNGRQLEQVPEAVFERRFEREVMSLFPVETRERKPRNH